MCAAFLSFLKLKKKKENLRNMFFKTILFFSRLEEQKNILSEFQRDLNEFVLWLEEADNISSIPLEPGNEQQLKEKLEEVKVILFSKISQGLLVYEPRGNSLVVRWLGLGHSLPWPEFNPWPRN